MPPSQRSKKKRSQDNNKVVAELESSRFISTNSDIALIEKTYKVRGTHAPDSAESINIASSAENSILSLNEGISSDLNELKEANPSKSSIASLEKKVNELSSVTRNLIKNKLEIEPRLSIIQPDIKYVDANLAYKYTDLQNDSSNMSNYFNLFLGIAIAELISTVVSIFGDPNSVQIAIHATAFLLSSIACIIFLRLARKTEAKVQKARSYLEPAKDDASQHLSTKKK